MARNRIVAAIALLGAIAATVIVAGGARSYSSARTPTRPAVTASSFEFTGPSSSCDGGTCHGQYQRGPSFRVPAGGPPYTAIITISMQYDTSDHGHFGFSTLLWKPPKGALHPKPRTRRLATSTSPQSTTLVYRVQHLRPGRRYTVRDAPNISNYGKGHRTMATHHVVVVVTATPDAQP